MSESAAAPGMRRWLWAYLAGAVLIVAYVRFVGPVVFVGDSLLLCDPAKYLAGRSLPGGATLYFFYRPLVSVLWVPAYFLRSPESIVFGVQVINALVYALALWPIFFLLRYYAKLTATESLLAAVALLLSPCALIYAPMFLTEAIYAPIFLFLVLATWRRTQTPGVGWDIACGLLMSLCYLSRHAGSIVPVAWGAAEGARWIRNGQDWRARCALMKSAAVVVAVAAVPIGLWMIADRYLDHGQGGGAGTTLFGELGANHEFALAWAGNLLLYLLWSPSGFLILVGALVFLTSPAAFTRDSTAVFVLGTVMLAIASTVLFQGSHWGDRSLALNRYLGPYVAPLSIIAWRHAQGAAGRYILVAAVIASVSWSLGFPEGINTHFQDYLAWTKLAAPEPKWWRAFYHSIFGLGMALGLVCCWRRWRVAAIGALLVFTFAWDVGAAVFWRDYSIRRCQPALESASKVWTAARQDHAPLVADEQKLTVFDREILLFQCFYPEQLPRAEFGRMPDLLKANPMVRMVTRSRFSTGGLFEPNAPVWEFPKTTDADVATLARIRPFPDESLVSLQVSGQRQSAVLLNDNLILVADSAGKDTAVELVLRVISPQVERTLRVADGSGAAQPPIQILKGTLKNGWREVRIPLRLQPGMNLINLNADGPIASIGRRETRMVIADKVDVRSLSEK